MKNYFLELYRLKRHQEAEVKTLQMELSMSKQRVKDLNEKLLNLITENEEISHLIKLIPKNAEYEQEVLENIKGTDEFNKKQKALDKLLASKNNGCKGPGLIFSGKGWPSKDIKREKELRQAYE